MSGPFLLSGMMKKFIASILFFTVATPSFSATSGIFLLRTQVPRRVSISIAPVSVASALDLSTTQTNLKVANATAMSNSKTGFKVTFTSANLGKLKRVTGAEVFPYSMKVGGLDVGLTTASGTTFNVDQTAPVTVSRDITISYTGKPAETMVEGTYLDTVTLTIAAR
jgi:hypothetical protein